MRIKYYLALIIMVCLCSTYLIEVSLSNKHEKIQHLSQRHMEYTLALRDFERLVNDVAQYMITVDLILGADETYLLEGTLKKGQLIIDSMEKIKEQIVNEAQIKSIESAKKLFIEQNNILNSSRDIPQTHRQEKLSILLNQSDDISSGLINILINTLDQIQIQNKHLEDKLQSEIDSTKHATLIARIAYAGIILILWLWSNARICKPIKNIADAANTITQSDTIDLVTKGPQEIQELSKQLQSVASELLYQARHDPLTGLYNRREFARQLSDEFKIAKNANQQRLLCFIDLDRFKSVNDSCGHAAGDDLLVMVAKNISSQAGEKSIVARLGGDEFAILLEQTDQSEGMKTADSILKMIRAIRFEWNDNIYRISASIGVTYVSNFHADVTDWLNAADSACFTAKEMGRDKIQLFEVNDKRLSDNRSETKLYNDIIDALENNRFTLYCQDIVPLQKSIGSLQHYEILVRMLSHEGEIIPPGKFLGAVEHFQLAERLDKWVIEATLTWLLNNPNHLKQLHTCSINLSGQSMASKDMRDFIKKKIAQTHFPAHKICFEVTETAAINDMQEAKLLIKEVGALGCKFALDDFGSGLSSFGYLQQLSVDTIKIDGEFVKDIENNPLNEIMVKCMNEITQTVGMTTIAEYVENAEIAKKLRAMGVNFAQGYYFDKPAPLTNRSDGIFLAANE